MKKATYLHILKTGSLVFTAGFCFSSAPVEAQDYPDTVQMPLQSCTFEEGLTPLQRGIHAYRIGPATQTIAQLSGANMFTNDALVLSGILPNGLHDSVDLDFDRMANDPEHLISIHPMLDAFGNSPFNQSFVGILMIRASVTNGVNNMWCSVVYFDNGDRSSVSNMIGNDDLYIGPNPYTGLSGTWVGNGGTGGDQVTVGATGLSGSSNAMGLESAGGCSIQFSSGETSLEFQWGLWMICALCVGFLVVARSLSASGARNTPSTSDSSRG